MIRIIFVIGLALITLSSRAATYYVATNGNDAASGGTSTPWATLSKAASVVAPGDLVMVRPGTHAGLNLTRAGTAGAPIVWQAESTATVGQVEIQTNNVTWRGFTHVGQIPIWTAAIGIRGSVSNVVVENCTVGSFERAYGIAFWPASGTAPEAGGSFCTIRSNTLDHIGYININVYGVSNLITQNTIRWSYGEGDAFRLWGRGHRVVNNLVHDLAKGAPPGVNLGGHPDFIQTFGSTGFDSYGHIIEGNIVFNVDSQLCQLEQNGANIHTWTFRQNLFMDTLSSASCSIPTNHWIGNTFIRVSKVTGHVINLSPPGYSRGASVGSSIINNAFIECGSNPTNNTYGWWSWPVGLDDLVVSNNFVCGPNGAAKRSDAGLRQWRYLPAYGINGGDPLVDVYGLPLAGSPLLDVGATRGDFSTDIVLQSRPVGAAWDIGIFERKSPQTPLSAWPFLAPEYSGWGTNGVGSATNAPPSRRFRSTHLRVGLLTLATNANAAEGP